jgi:YgiT-type zinc finger domain-containing protein
MASELDRSCTECGGNLVSHTISQTFERGGLTVTVSGIRAQVCETCGETYFEPGGAQALVEAVDRLFALAKRNGQVKGQLTGSVAA